MYSFLKFFSALLIFCGSLSTAAFCAQVFEIYNKDDESVKLTAKIYGAQFSKTIEDIEIASKKNLQAEIKEADVNKVLSIEIKIVRGSRVFEFFVAPSERNVLLSFDSKKSPPLYPETGKLKGWLGKTESGLYLKNNVESTSIVVFDKEKPTPEQIAQKRIEKDACNGGAIPPGSLGLRSNQGTCLVVDLAVAKQSTTIKNLLIDTDATAAVPIPSLNDKNLTSLFELMKVICNKQGDNCDKYVDEAQRLKSKLPTDAVALTGIVGAANYLDVPAILEAGLEQIRQGYVNKDESALRQLALALKENPLPKDLLVQIAPIAFDNLKPFATVSHPEWVRCIAISPSGKHWATCDKQGNVRIWKIEPSSDPKPIATFEHRDSYLLAFSPDGAYLATGRGSEGVKLWNVEPSVNPRPFASFWDDGLNTQGMGFNPDGNLLHRRSYENKVELYKLYNLDPVSGLVPAPIAIFENASFFRLLQGREIESKAFSPDGKYLAVGYRDAWELWKNDTAGNRKPIASFKTVSTVSLKKIFGGSNTVNSVAFSADGKYLATGSTYSGASIWRVEPATFPAPIATFLPQSEIFTVVFSPNGKYLATVSGDYQVFIWNTSSGKNSQPAAIIERSGSPVFSPDGKFLAVSSKEFKRATLYQAGQMDVESFTKYLNQLAK